MSYIKFANVSLKGNGKNILNDVTFDVEKGEVCLIISQYLSGILNILSNDVNASSGVVMADDMLLNSLQKKNRKKYLKEVAHVHPDNDLIKNLTVYENIYLACEQNKKKNKVKYYINKLGLSKKLDLYPAQLKEFDTQKTKLAMLLCKEPSIILYDGIDLLQKNQRINILKVLVKESKKNKTTILIESKKAELRKGVNKVITIKNGEAKARKNKKVVLAGDLK